MHGLALKHPHFGPCISRTGARVQPSHPLQSLPVSGEPGNASCNVHTQVVQEFSAANDRTYKQLFNIYLIHAFNNFSTFGATVARRAHRTVWITALFKDLLFAFPCNSLCVPVAAGVIYPVFGLLFSPRFAAVAMSLSPVSVISNALDFRNLNIEGCCTCASPVFFRMMHHLLPY